jgi:hypothetical protein
MPMPATSVNFRKCFNISIPPGQDVWTPPLPQDVSSTTTPRHPSGLHLISAHSPALPVRWRPVPGDAGRRKGKAFARLPAFRADAREV